jgi:orotate phosphoribosyltransferase
MKPDDVIRLFRESGGLLDGHFLLASGRHSDEFFQAARVTQYVRNTALLCAATAERFANDRIELVAGPAAGGIILAYETARHLNARAVYTEKDEAGRMTLRRGFSLKPGTRTLVVEDVITTGGSVQKSIDHLAGRGAEIVGVSVLIDRSGGKVSFAYRYEPLARYVMQTWPPEECPLCRKGLPIVDPDDIVV